MSSRQGNTAILLLIILLGLGAVAFVLIGGFLGVGTVEESPALKETPQSQPAGPQRPDPTPDSSR